MLKVPWEAPKNPELQPYLKPTELCEPDHPEIPKITAEVVKGAKTPREAAIKIYFFVRDEIKFHFEHPKPSIDVLRSRRGPCFNKANLQVAMLRAAKIPARYRVETFLPQFIFVFIPEALWEMAYEAYKMQSEKPVSNLVPTFFTHGLTEAYVDGKWIGCDATFDKDLLPLAIDWDGKHDLTVTLPWRKAITGTTASSPVKQLKEVFELITQDVLDYINEVINSVREMAETKKYQKFLEVYGKATIKNYETEARKWKEWCEKREKT